MNTLIITNLFPSAQEPWRGLFNLRRFEALAKFCPVHVIAPVPAWKRLGRPMDLVRAPEERVEGVSASYPASWTLPRVMPQWHATQMHRSIHSHVRVVCKAFPFDVVLGAFAYPDAVVASRVAADAGCPFVALVMGSDMNDLAQRPPLRGVIRDALSKAACVVAVSRALQQRVLELGIPPERTLVQHNGVNGERFRIRDKDETRRSLGIPDHERLVTFVGNLVHEKGPDILIEALGRMHAEGGNVRAALIGEGSEKQALLSRTAALGIRERVSFLGRLSPDDVARWIAASDVLCLPSRREGCPNVVLEALASGRPVVAAAVGGVPELLSDISGEMVAPGDPEALAGGLSAAFRRRWNPSELRASVPSLTWEDVGRTLRTVVGNALSERRPT